MRELKKKGKKKGQKKSKDKSGSSDENGTIQKVAVVLKSANAEPYKLVKGKDKIKGTIDILDPEKDYFPILGSDVEESERSRSRSRSTKGSKKDAGETEVVLGDNAFKYATLSREVLDYSRLPCHCSKSFLHWPRITSPLVLPERIDGRGRWQRGRIQL